jgi:DNA-binding NtrC family response regulator
MSLQRPGMLVIDDEADQIRLAGEVAEAAGFDLVTCTSVEAALLADAPPIDLILADQRLLHGAGGGGVRALGGRYRLARLVVTAGRAEVEGVVEAIGHGACDYLEKPLDPERLCEHVRQARLAAARRPMLSSAPVADAAGDFCGMIGRSEAMRQLFGLIARVAPRTRSALVTGETGTGKELVAHAMHTLGPRAGRRFVAVNCCAADRLSFAGAGLEDAAGDGDRAARGDVFAAAQGGTLFLDRVDALPLRAQARLLRVMETGELFVLDALEPRRVDVHVIASTSHDLRRAIAEGRFRADLFLQLAVIELGLPRLDERRDDIPRLGQAFVRQCATRLRKPLFGLDAEAAARLAAAEWPGHVRELRNVIERACLFAGGDLVTGRDVALALPARRRAGGPPAGRPAFDASPAALAGARARVARALASTHGNKAAAARLLGISRRALYRRLARLSRAEEQPDGGVGAGVAR